MKNYPNATSSVSNPIVSFVVHRTANEPLKCVGLKVMTLKKIIMAGDDYLTY